jgi:hypothetical protein
VTDFGERDGELRGGKREEGRERAGARGRERAGGGEGGEGGARGKEGDGEMQQGPCQSHDFHYTASEST